MVSAQECATNCSVVSSRKRGLFNTLGKLLRFERGEPGDSDGARRFEIEPAARGLFNTDQQSPEVAPVEGRTGVGLATWSDVGVADDVDNRISPAQIPQQSGQT